MFIVAILAGGKGTRLWPLSNDETPKPFIPIINNITLFSETIKRAKKLNPDKIVCITNQRFLPLIENKDIDEYILEKEGKNTAPAIIFSSRYLMKKYQCNPEIIFMPADHWIENDSEFVSVVKQAILDARKNKIVTLGIRPTRIESGFGYILHEKNRVLCFEEKPKPIRAEQLIREGALWNSGIFCFNGKTIERECRKYCSPLFDGIDNASTVTENNLLFVDYKNIDEISIDKALMEKSSELIVRTADLGWDDIGTFNAFFKLKNQLEPSGGNNNVTIHGEGFEIDCSDVSIQTNKNVIATIGLKHAFIVSHDNQVLIVDKDKVQQVKDVIPFLAKNTFIFGKIVRPWGSYQVICKGKNFLVKQIRVYPNAALSLQSHRYRDEHWIITEGNPKVIIGEKELILKPNQQIFIPKNEKHRMINTSKEQITFIEVQYGQILSETDIIRFDDIYGRH